MATLNENQFRSRPRKNDVKCWKCGSHIGKEEAVKGSVYAPTSGTPFEHKNQETCRKLRNR